MRFKEVIINNVGLFKGVQKINLESSKSQNIILFGGQNGNGKTTLFEAIRLCLYGKKILNIKTDKKYYSYLKSLIHHSEDGIKEKNAEISIHFDHANNGIKKSFEVVRSWFLDKSNSVTEHFEVKEDGMLLKDMSTEGWEDFINSLIPFGLSKLFFFDGEKIQDLAEESDLNYEFIESFKLMLGVDLVERLNVDLNNYTIKRAKEIGTDDLKSELSEVEDNINILQSSIDDILQEKSKIQTNVDSLLLSIEKNEAKIKKEGGFFASKRDELIKQRDILRVKIDSEEDELRTLAHEGLPLIFSEKINAELLNTLIKEESNINKQKVLEYLETDGKELFSLIKSEKLEGISLISKLKKEINSNLSKSLVHNLNSKESYTIMSQIESVPKTKAVFESKVKEVNKLKSKFEKLEEQISFAPDKLSIEPYLNRISSLHEKVGSERIVLNDLNEKLKFHTMNLDAKNKLKSKVIQKIKDQKSEEYRFELIEKVKGVLSEFYEHHKKQKLDLFTKEFLLSYETISRKKGVFEKITIDPDNFKITLYKKGGVKIKKSQLSAGERQIYAISILWTLTKISKRDLPFIIDTPLGRLDENHRSNLISTFFTKASDQVIILSTDTEINKNYYEKLDKRISRSYLFDYKDGETKIKGGYFWK